MCFQCFDRLANNLKYDCLYLTVCTVFILNWDGLRNEVFYVLYIDVSVFISSFYLTTVENQTRNDHYTITHQPPTQSDTNRRALSWVTNRIATSCRPRGAIRLCFTKLKLLLLAIEIKGIEEGVDSKISINPRGAKIQANTQGFFIAQSADEVKRWVYSRLHVGVSGGWFVGARPPSIHSLSAGLISRIIMSLPPH